MNKVEKIKRTPADIEAAMQEVEEKSRLFTEAHKDDNCLEISRHGNSHIEISEDLEEAAWLQYDRNKPLMPPELDLHKEFIDFFIAGAQWQKQQTIDKACEWLKSYRRETPDGTSYIPGIVDDETIEEFNKAMEE